MAVTAAVAWMVFSWGHGLQDGARSGILMADQPTSGALVAERRVADGREWPPAEAPAAATLPGAPSPSPARRPARGPVVRAAEVLRAWDEQRAAAYARGDVVALRDLYVGRAGRADVRLLRSYLDRGLRVRGLQMQLLAVEVLGHRPGRWTLEVTDRLAAARAVGRGGVTVLPSDRASVHLVRLVRGDDGRWRAAAVSGGGPR